MDQIDTAIISRAQGCLLGQLAGDALGSQVEFCSPEKIMELYPGGLHLADGGIWNTIAGQPTDDSEMALVLARSIVRQGGYHPDRALEAYRWWRDSMPFDIGRTIHGALMGRHDSRSQANGAMMRISPLGIFGSRFSLGETAQWAMADAALTHINPVCRQANALYAMAIAEAVRSGPEPEALYTSLLGWMEEMEVDLMLAETIKRAAGSPPADYLTNAGWVLVAFQNALYQLLHANDPGEAILETAMQGGDADTTAAICGALLGAVYGIETIPEVWRSTILGCRPERGNPRVQRPRPKELWPIDALELAEQLVGKGTEA
ncbi:MAG: ADP-ribosylglycohydrolase family protein [Chlorobiaceae bacterium]|nr:ADP-ribosylglycohydrolase family protein [Chlorobiaceae bacterium]